MGSRFSANNFDTKLKNGVRTVEKDSKKIIEKEEVQGQFNSKSEGKVNLFGNSNLNNKTKEKNPLISPIHQKTISNSNKIDSDQATASSYPIPLDTPLPPAIPFGGHNESNDPMTVNSQNYNIEYKYKNDIELNDNQEREPLVSKDNDMNIHSQNPGESPNRTNTSTENHSDDKEELQSNL